MSTKVLWTPEERSHNDFERVVEQYAQYTEKTRPLQEMIKDSGREWSVRQKTKLDELLRGARAKHREQLTAERRAVKAAERDAQNWRLRYEEAIEGQEMNTTQWHQRLDRHLDRVNIMAVSAFSQEINVLSQNIYDTIYEARPQEMSTYLHFSRCTPLPQRKMSFDDANKAKQLLSTKLEAAITKALDKENRSLMQYTTACQNEIFVHCAHCMLQEMERHEKVLVKIDTDWRKWALPLLEYERVQRRIDAAHAAAAEARLYVRLHTSRAVFCLSRVHDAIHYSENGSETSRASIACLQRELEVVESRAISDLREERKQRDSLLESLGTHHAQEMLALRTDHQIEIEQLRQEHADECQNLEESIRSKTLDEMRPALQEQVRAALAANDAAHEWHRPQFKNDQELHKLQEELKEAHRRNLILHKKLAEARRSEEEILTAAKDAYLADRTISSGRRRSASKSTFLLDHEYDESFTIRSNDDDILIARRKINYDSAPDTIPLVSYLATNLDRTRRRSPPSTATTATKLRESQHLQQHRRSPSSSM